MNNLQEVKVNTEDFFQEIEHSEVPWKQYQLHVPVFYPDIMLMTVSILAPLESVKKLLPSTRLKPYRLSPWHSTISITTYQYRQSDLGPYNEVAISIPVTIDQDTPLFTGVIRKLPKETMAYMRHLPVSTEIARVVGVEFAGYPKFVAEIEFREEDDWVTCELAADGQQILELSGRKLGLEKFPRFRMHPLTSRRGYILRSELVVSESEMGMSTRKGDVKLVLGDHPIAAELRGLNLGKVLSYGYCPRAKGVLTPVFESFAGSAPQ
jgi:hypothetical protein